MLVNFNMIFDKVQGAKHSQSLSSGEYLQRGNLRKEIKIIGNFWLDNALVDSCIRYW